MYPLGKKPGRCFAAMVLIGAILVLSGGFLGYFPGRTYAIDWLEKLGALASSIGAFLFIVGFAVLYGDDGTNCGSSMKRDNRE